MGSVKWQASPINSNELDYLEFALGEFLPVESDARAKLTNQFDMIRAIMNKPGSFYAYNHRLGDIDFFIVDPIGNRVIIINHNT